jgi:uncharacterized FAD-dependent dehydrogenase
MRYLLKDIRIQVDASQDLEKKILSSLKSEKTSLISWKITRRAIDTRKVNQPYYVYTVEIETDKSIAANSDLIPVKSILPVKLPEIKLGNQSPMIIGMGPAGLFCALAMVERGFTPVLLDRGTALEQRAIAVNNFWHKGILDPDSNVQFGEGGAGAFSDGKLTSRTRNSSTEAVFLNLIKFGAPESIAYDALPHLGTDGIRRIVSEIKNFLQSKGCRFVYNSKLQRLDIADGRLRAVKINGETHSPELLILAPGNAARDTFTMLAETGVELRAKPFAIGFRISHPQDWINKTVYGGDAWSEKLGAASYRLTSKQSGKGTYTFCMCPGGHVIAASSEPESIVTNGMSYSDRKYAYGNSAIVSVVNEFDYGKALFDGINFQSRIERKPYQKGYYAPYQKAADYLSDRISAQQKVSCLFADSVPYMISDLFSSELNQALKKALHYFNKIMPGFIQEGLLIAPETRTSSPIRIIRDPINGNCLGISNLYAVGEGSGYAGGIISSAADGYNTGSKFTL